LGYELLDSEVSSAGSGSPGSNGTGGVNPSTGGGTASDAGDSGVAASFASGGSGSVATGSGGDSAGAGDSLGDAGQSAAGTGPLGIGGDPGSSSGGTGSSSGGTGGTGSSSGGSGGTGGGSATGCDPAVPAATWAFDKTVEAWQLSLNNGTSGTLVWTGATGNPTPGALQLDATISGKQTVRVLLEQTFPDLTGKTLYLRVFLDSGSDVMVKPFVQTGADHDGSEGPPVVPATQQWTCLNLDFANPTTGGATIDPTDVRRIGVLVLGNTTVRLYTDYVTY
jgi:hypothetical protein